jgi:galactokinase/mevalonate kinase-like predicted kinase
VINSLAPIRINDFGGWTDVRFAKHGCVLNIAVSPCVEVQLRVFDKTANRPRVVIVAENYKHTYEWKGEQKWDQHPLIEACLMFMNVVSSYAFEVAIFSEGLYCFLLFVLFFFFLFF